MLSLKFMRCPLFSVGLSWACGLACGIDRATLEAGVQWNASAFRTAIVCDEPGRLTVALPEVITQKVQESFQTNGLDYWRRALSYSEREDHVSLESYRLPTNYYGQVYRYTFPNNKSRFLFVYSQIGTEISRRVSFWIYDSAKGRASVSSAAQSTRWLDPGIENGTSTNRLGDPYITFVDIDRDGVPEVVSCEAKHAGTDDWQLYYHYYGVDTDLSLTRVLTRPAEVFVFAPRGRGGWLRSRLVPLGNGRVRIEVCAWKLSPLKDGTVVASYTCEHRASNPAFEPVECRVETNFELDPLLHSLGFFDHALGLAESRVKQSYRETAPLLRDDWPGPTSETRDDENL